MDESLTPDTDDYDVFLDTWEESELLDYATSDAYLFDPLPQQRLLQDMEGNAKVERTPNVKGTKALAADEVGVRRNDYFKLKQAEWSAEFHSRAISAGLDEDKIATFIRCFAEDWIKGKKRRQEGPDMLTIKASIRDHDRRYEKQNAGKYVLHGVPEEVPALFTPEEMADIFQINCDLLEHYIPDYIAALHGKDSGSINTLYVRRGVNMPETPGENRVELNYLSSYSFAITPAEQFAQTFDTRSTGARLPCMFSAPLPALQQRVVAFAPFISNMDLGQMELVVAPPIRATPLTHRGRYGGIEEYSFD